MMTCFLLKFISGWHVYFCFVSYSCDFNVKIVSGTRIWKWHFCRECDRWFHFIRWDYILALHAKFFRGNKNIYLHFMSFLHIDMTQVVEILPQVRQELTYSTYSQYPPILHTVNIMGADVLVMQGARALETMTLTMLNQINSPWHLTLLLI